MSIHPDKNMHAGWLIKLGRSSKDSPRLMTFGKNKKKRYFQLSRWYICSPWLMLNSYDNLGFRLTKILSRCFVQRHLLLLQRFHEQRPHKFSEDGWCWYNRRGGYKQRIIHLHRGSTTILHFCHAWYRTDIQMFAHVARNDLYILYCRKHKHAGCVCPPTLRRPRRCGWTTLERISWCPIHSSLTPKRRT